MPEMWVDAVMVDVTLPTQTAGATAPGVSGINNWFSRVESLFKEFNRTLDNVQRLRGQTPPAGQSNVEVLYEQAEQRGPAQPAALPAPGPNLQTVKAKILEALDKADMLGLTDKNIIDVVQALGITLRQVRGLVDQWNP